MTEKQDLSGARILVVEDDFLQSKELCASLIDAGAFIVGPEATLEGAMSLAEEQECEAAIFDLRLGQHNATSFARKLLQRRIPFVIYTGYPDSAFCKLDWPGCKLVSKPSDMKYLISVLADLVKWRQRVQNY